MLETQHSAEVEQLELGAVQRRQVFLSDRAVVADHVARQQPRLAVAESAQVLHHLVQGAVVGAHAHAAVALAPARGLLADDADQLFLAGQRQGEARGEALDFRRQLERMGNQHHGGPRRAFGHGDLLQQAHHLRIVGEERMQVAEHVEIGLLVGLDRAQGSLHLAAVALHQRLAAEAQALQALGHRPGVQAVAAPDRQPGQGFQHPRLVPGFDGDQLDPRVQHQPQVVDIVLQCSLLARAAHAGRTESR
ncbi:hypothetical protein D9M71_463470 [compost metagenome]